VKVINQKGTTILLVEQNLKTIKNVCRGIYIMEKGSIVYEGTPSELEGAMDIQERYLSVKV
jgi:ABC-type branched-subunit amino acid transport system ATPase component